MNYTIKASYKDLSTASYQNSDRQKKNKEQKTAIG